MKKIYLFLFSIILLSATGVNAQCTADYSHSVNNYTVNFTNLSTYPPGMLIDYHWWYGDGNSSRLVSPTHTYTQAGTYIVYLSMFDSLNTCFDSTSYYVTVPVSNCSASYTIGVDSNAAFGVVLTNTSSNLSTHNYYWSFGDGNTANVRNPTHTYSNFGSYQVCLTIIDSIQNCTSTFCDSVGMDSLGRLKANAFGLRVMDPVVTSLDEEDLNNVISIYPNPAEDLISIDLSSLESVERIQLFDLSGKVVLETSSVSNSQKSVLDLSELEKGVYIVRINSGSELYTQKIVKQ